MAVVRGAMIVFEGCDRCGKSTQCLKLLEYLQSVGRKAQLFRFPGLYAFCTEYYHRNIFGSQLMNFRLPNLTKIKNINILTNSWVLRYSLITLRIHLGECMWLVLAGLVNNWYIEGQM